MVCILSAFQGLHSQSGGAVEKDLVIAKYQTDLLSRLVVSF